MATNLACSLALASLLCASVSVASESIGTKAPSSFEAPAEPSLGLTALAGVHLPSCVGTGGCDSRLDPAPSVRALVLYQPNARWGVGLAAQVAAVHWRATYLPYNSNPTLQTIESDLAAGFWGVAVRYSMMPDWSVTPIVELVVGSAFQMQTGSNFNCNSGFAPTSQVGIGGRAQVMPELSLFAMASASGGFRSFDCAVADGPPPTPLAAWGYGLHAGAAFDIGFCTAPSGAPVAWR